jgi:hypothetical protein
MCVGDSRTEFYSGTIQHKIVPTGGLISFMLFSIRYPEQLQ